MKLFLTLVVACFSGASANAQTEIFLLKTHNYAQTANNTNSEQSSPWGLLAIIRGSGTDSGSPSSPNFIATASDPGTHLLDLSYSQGTWTGEMRFATEDALNAAIADGAYVFNFGSNSQSLTIAGGLFPNNPVLGGNDYWSDGAIRLNPSLPFNQYTGTYNLNFASGGTSWSTVGILGTNHQTTSQLNEGDFENASGALGDLVFGTNYELQSGFYRFTDVATDAGGVLGVTAYAGYATLNTMQLQAIPEPATWAMIASILVFGCAVISRRRN